MSLLPSNQIHDIYRHKNHFEYEGMEQAITRAIDKPDARLKLPPNFGKKRVAKGCGRFTLLLSLIWKKFCLSWKITFERGYREKYYKGLEKIESHIRHLQTNPIRHTPIIPNTPSDGDLTASPSSSNEDLSPEQAATKQLIQSLNTELESKNTLKQTQSTKLTELLAQKSPLDESFRNNKKLLEEKSAEVLTLDGQSKTDIKRDADLASLQKLATEYTHLNWLRRKMYEGANILVLKPDFNWNDPDKEIQNILSERLAIEARTKKNAEIIAADQLAIQDLETNQNYLRSQLLPLNQEIEMAMAALREVETSIHKLRFKIAVLEDKEPPVDATNDEDGYELRVKIAVLEDKEPPVDATNDEDGYEYFDFDDFLETSNSLDNKVDETSTVASS